MVVNEENRAVVTQTPSGDMLISSPDGKESVSVTKEVAEAIIAESQRKCSGSAADLQPKNSGFTPPPNQAGKPLIKDDIFKDLEQLLDNKEWVAGYSQFANINQLFATQNNLTKEMQNALVKKGLFTSPESASGLLERRYLPLYRVEKKNKEISKLRKINIFLSITLISTLIYFTQYNQTEKSPVPPEPQAEQTAAIQTDSTIKYDELHIYITEYCKLKNIKVYPYSERVILERINAKKITNIEGVKNEIETRINELSKR